MPPPRNSRKTMNQRRRANMASLPPNMAGLSGLRFDWPPRRRQPAPDGAGDPPSSGGGRAPGAPHQDLLMGAGDLGVEGERGLGEVGFGALFRLEIVELVDAADQGGRVMGSDDLPHMGRQVADGEADAAPARRIRIGA